MMNRIEFWSKELPEGFYWFNEPAEYSSDPRLKIATKPKTDFWQRTHYDIRKDDGHCLYTNMSGNFAIETKAVFTPNAQYDQCGLMIRADSENWIKCSVEYENTSVSRLGSVITNGGFSDWATQDVSTPLHSMCYRISKRGSDFMIEHSCDGKDWHQIRMAHLSHGTDSLKIGVYACSPVGEGFECGFEYLQISDSRWTND